MSSFSISNGFKSPINFISSLVGNADTNILERKIQDVRLNLKEIIDLEQRTLEELNSYKTFDLEDLETFEKEIDSYNFIFGLMHQISLFCHEAKSEVDESDKFYNDLILLSNDLINTSEAIQKVLNKLNYIHNRILVKSSELSSSHILDDIWEKDGDVWNEFYKESNAS